VAKALPARSRHTAALAKIKPKVLIIGAPFVLDPD
jgi:hypothetical protein